MNYIFYIIYYIYYIPSSISTCFPDLEHVSSISDDTASLLKYDSIRILGPRQEQQLPYFFEEIPAWC